MVICCRKVAFKHYGPFKFVSFYYVPCALIMFLCLATALEIVSRRRKRNIGESSARNNKMGITNHYYKKKQVF